MSWIVGDVARVDLPAVDLAIMTGHVAQFFLGDRDWRDVLVALRTALRPGGRLAFETRNRDAREWKGWTRSASSSAIDPAGGEIRTWSEVQEVGGGAVSYTLHYLFMAAGEKIEAPTRLRLRTEEEIRQSLTDRGFVVEQLYGDWNYRRVSATSPELIFVART